MPRTLQTNNSFVRVLNAHELLHEPATHSKRIFKRIKTVHELNASHQASINFMCRFIFQEITTEKKNDAHRQKNINSRLTWKLIARDCKRSLSVIDFRFGSFCLDEFMTSSQADIKC